MEYKNKEFWVNYYQKLNNYEELSECFDKVDTGDTILFTFPENEILGTVTELATDTIYVRIDCTGDEFRTSSSLIIKKSNVDKYYFKVND